MKVGSKVVRGELRKRRTTGRVRAMGLHDPVDELLLYSVEPDSRWTEVQSLWGNFNTRQEPFTEEGTDCLSEERERERMTTTENKRRKGSKGLI